MLEDRIFELVDGNKFYVIKEKEINNKTYIISAQCDPDNGKINTEELSLHEVEIKNEDDLLSKIEELNKIANEYVNDKSYNIARHALSQSDIATVSASKDAVADMDFKVAGTREGICAMQMDIKIKGVSREILAEALAQAKKARMQILDVMESAISEPRRELSPYAPKIEMFNINPEKIKDVIGRGGEMITKIILEASNVKTVQDKDAVKVDLEDDGRVIIYHSDANIIARTREMIESVVREVEIGKTYSVRVVSIQDFGAFVELWPGCEGLVHVSHLDSKRVEKVSDVVSVGDEILVRATGYDKKGKLNLSRKELLVPKKEEKKKDKCEDKE